MDAASSPACRSRRSCVDFLGEVAQRRADPERAARASRRRFPTARWSSGCTRADDADPRRPARRRRRHRGRLGRLVAEDAAGRRVLLDRQRPRRADALDVRRRAARRAARRFVLDQGGKVSHFNYFSNERTAEAIVDALIDEDAPPGFRAIGPLSWAGESATGVRARARAARRRRGRPASSRRCSCCPASSAATSRSTASASGSAGASSTA